HHLHHRRNHRIHCEYFGGRFHTAADPGRGGVHGRSIGANLRLIGGFGLLRQAKWEQRRWRPGQVMGRDTLSFSVFFFPAWTIGHTLAVLLEGTRRRNSWILYVRNVWIT